MSSASRARPEPDRGTPRPHTSLILFTNLASPGESGEICAAAPTSPSPIRLQLWGETVVGPKPGRLSIPSSTRISACSRAIGFPGPGGRREPPDPETCKDERQAAGLPPHRSRAPGQSSERGRTHCLHRNDRAPSGCAFAADHLPCPPAVAHTSRTLHFSEETSFSPFTLPGHDHLPAPLSWDCVVGGGSLEPPYGLSTARRLRPERAAEPADSGSREEGCGPRVKTARPRSRRTWGSGFPATALPQASPSPERHAAGGRGQGDASRCVRASASGVSAPTV